MEAVVERRRQQTLGAAVSYSGIGLHTGEVVQMKLVPADEDTGIVVRRTDLPGQPVIPASVPFLRDASDRCTTIGQGTIRIYTVEHLLAALYSNRIDNVVIELSNIEPPIGNGSSDIFVDMIQRVNFVEQSAFRSVLSLQEPVYYSSGESHLVAIPHPAYQISYTLSYPGCPVLGAQYRSFQIDAELFNRELAPCRTFCRYSEINMLMDRGLIKGGSLDNAVVIDGEAVFSKNGLFFSDEMVRHKILDMVGDLALVGCDLCMHIIAIRAGHATHCALAELLYKILNK